MVIRMKESGGKKHIVFWAEIFLLVFYMAVMLYIFFAVLHFHLLPNFATGMAFEILGFCFLAILLLGNTISKPIKNGYFIPLVITTAGYTILLNLLNVLAAVFMPVVFFLLHFVLLFVFCLVFIPMYLLGKQ